jgi:hypothetical protein
MTTINSPWASTPIVTDGNLEAATWAGAGKLELGSGGAMWVKNDAHWLYAALDVPGDNGAAGDKDYFWLSVDVDGNRQITPNVDINYGEYPPSDTTLGIQKYLGAGDWTGISAINGGEEYIQTVAPSPASPTPHRVWQMKLALSELGVEFNSAALQTIGFGVRIASPAGTTTDYPPNFDSNFSDLNEIVLASNPSEIYPPGTEGAVIAGVGFIPATLITGGYATTPSSYSLYPGLIDYAFCGSLQIKGNHSTIIDLWNAGARHYKLSLDGAPLLTSWDNYVWNGSTFVLEAFGPNANGQYSLYDPSTEYIVSDLLAFWNTVGTAAGLHSLTVEFYKADGSTVVASTPQTLELMIDNNLPLAVINTAMYEGLPIATCGIETLGGSVTFDITADSALGHLDSYTLAANWDAGSAVIDSDTYSPSHVSASGWNGVSDVGPIPATGWKPPVQCAYEFVLTAYMRTTTGIPQGNPYAQDSRFVAFIALT